MMIYLLVLRSGIAPNGKSHLPLSSDLLRYRKSNKKTRETFHDAIDQTEVTLLIVGFENGTTQPNATV